MTNPIATQERRHEGELSAGAAALSGVVCSQGWLHTSSGAVAVSFSGRGILIS